MVSSDEPVFLNATAGSRRGEILRRLGLMNETDEREFDELVELASVLCDKTFGAMTLIDEETQLIKARVGINGRRTMSVRNSICQYTIEGTDMLVVEDTANDARFGGPVDGIRFYAGMPLVTVDGTAVGALCVMDTEPSKLTMQQQRALEILGRQLSNRIQLREHALSVSEMMAERERSREIFSTILNNVPVEIYLKDRAGRICFYNHKLAERFGVSEQEWLGKTSWDLWDKQTADDIARDDAQVFRSGKTQDSFVELHEAGQRQSFWRSTKVLCRDMNGEPMLACCSVDMTEQMERERSLQEVQDALEEANRKLNSLALTDALTGLWNRRAFNARLETIILGSRLGREPMAMMMMDVDNFKGVNDRYGHSCGDVVLRNVASILNRIKRADDIACRFGGEEFALLLPNVDEAGAVTVAKRMLDAMHAFSWDKEKVTISIGIAICRGAFSGDSLVDEADAAMYEAKRSGKDRYAIRICDELRIDRNATDEA